MNDMHIGIIGGMRGMGKWFARFLEKQGFSIHISGRKTGMNVKEMASLCEVVIVSVPIGDTLAVIGDVGPYMRRDSLLMDLTSLKREPVRTMLTSSVSEVIGCHPLFGPEIDSMEGQHVVVCPARGQRWISWLRTVLSKHGAHIVETTPECHDQMMAIVQGLNHFNTVAMGMALSQSGTALSDLKLFSTPAFNAKVKIIEKVFCQNPRLYAEILTMNPDIHPFIEIYAKVVATLKDVIYQDDSGRMTDLIEKAADYLRSTDYH
jgi:prephenate dehydrogenase